MQTTTVTRLEHSDDATADVLVVPENGDRFVVRVNDAILGCQSVVRHGKIQEQICALETKLRAWVGAHGNDVQRAVLSMDRDGYLFIVIQKSERFEPEIEDAVAQLDLDVANDDELDLIQLRAMAVPNASPETLQNLVNLSGLEAGSPA